MKRIFTLISLALVVCLLVFAMTACGDAEVTIGENGNWFVGEEDTGVKAAGTNASIGSNGNWYLDGIDSGKKAVGTDAEKVTIGENGNWFIGTTDTGVKAVCGKYVVDVQTSTELDAKWGKQYAITVITYSDGTTETQRNEVPQPVSHISLNTYSNEFYAGYAPTVELQVDTYGSYNYCVPVTDDMYIGQKPDFNTPGNYILAVGYGGQYDYSHITVLDATDAQITDMYLNRDAVRKGTPVSEILLNIEITNPTHGPKTYTVALNECTGFDFTSFDTVSERFKFTANYKGFTKEIYITVYDPEVNNIDSVNLPSISESIPFGADAATVKSFFEAYLIGQYFDAYFYDMIYGTHFFQFIFTDDMVDYSDLDTSIPGRHIITVNVALDGIGSYTKKMYVEVEPDIAGATLLNTYHSNSMLGSMLGDIQAYDNGIAYLTGEGGTWAAYTLDSTGTLVTAKSGDMTLYFTIDNTNNTYDIYIPADEAPSATYVAAEVTLQIKVYSSCVVLCTYQPADGTNPEISIPIYSMPSSIIVNNTVEFRGMLIQLNSDGTATMID